MTGRPGNWGTWQPEYPAALAHLGTGLILTPLLYSARAQAVSLLKPGPDIRFGRRDLDGHSISFDTDFAETELSWRYKFIENDTLALSWYCHSHGEWGLRYWVTLCLQGEECTDFSYDEASGILRAQFDAGLLEVRAAKNPLLVTFHDNFQDLVQEFEEKGYFYLASRDRKGPLVALRFNLEEAPDMEVALRLSGDESEPLARPALPRLRDRDEGPNKEPEQQEALQAVYDVMAWNHVYDSLNKRPYTLLTRFWNQQKFGGFGVWLNDILYNALMWGLFDRQAARDNLEAVFAWQTEAGNFPCLVTGNDAWLDRSQPPIAAFIVWTLYQLGEDRGFLSRAYPKLLRNFDWWWRSRSLGDSGLVAYGTSRQVGRGLYKGTKLAAKDESSMDNSPVHDPAPFDEESGLLLSADVGLNALLALEGEILSKMAAELGHEEEVVRLERTSRDHKERIRTRLWDPKRRVFANRLQDGSFVEALAPTSFYPLAAGAADDEQVEALITDYLNNPAKFGGTPGLPSVARDHETYRDNVYWRGRIWGPLNFWVYQGLRRAGRDNDARDLAEMGWKLFEKGWRNRLCGENYNADSGAILDQADSDGFYAWGALLPLLAVSEVFDATPWQGLSLEPAKAEKSLGSLRCPPGNMEVQRGARGWQIFLNDAPFLEGNLQGRMSHVVFASDEFSARLPEGLAGEVLVFPAKNLKTVRLDGKDCPFRAGEIILPEREARQELHVTWHELEIS